MPARQRGREPTGVETGWKPLPAIRRDTTFSRRSRFPLSMGLRRLPAANGDPPGMFCKPEVTGSIPVRSIKYLQNPHFLFSSRTRSRSNHTSTAGAEAGESRL